MSRYRQTMSELLEQVRAPKENIDNDYLKPRMTPQQIANIKKTWQNKKASDVTPAIKKMIKDMDIPTQMAIKQANIPHISKLVEEDDHEISMARGELEAVADKALKLSAMLQGKSDDDQLEAWVQSKITKAKDYINSVVDYMTYNPDFATEHMIEAFSDQQIAKLKKEYEPLRGARISVTNANKLGAMFTKFDSNKNALEKLYGGNIPFISQMAMSRLISKHGYTADKIKKIKVAEEVEVLEEGTGTIKGFRNDKEKSNMISLAKQHSLKVKEVSGGIELSGNMRKILDMQLAAQGNGLKAEEYINEGRMSEIDAMRKAGATAADIAKELKLSVKVVKSILGEEIEEDEPKKETKEDDKEKLKSEIEKKDAEINQLKAKAETQKAKVAKKETEKLVNPETGEPLLQIGVAYKHLKDKMAKEEVTEMKKDDAYAIGMAQAKKVMNDEPPLQKKTIKKGHEIADKILKKENTITEFKRMTVRIRDKNKMKKAIADLEKQNLGLSVLDKGMYQVIQVVGNNRDLNNIAKDLKNFYGAEIKAEETIVEFTSQQIKMAYGVANDKRYKGGNYSGAVKAIEKIARGLSQHPDVQKVLKRTNENLDEGKYTRYSDLLIQLGRMKQAKDKQGEMNTQKEIDKEKKKLGINESAAAAEIQKNNTRRDSMDYNMYKKSVELLRKKDYKALGKHIYDAETAPREYVMGVIDKKEPQAFKKMFGNQSGYYSLMKPLKMSKEEVNMKEHPAKAVYEQIKGLKNKAEKSGMPYSILKKVYDRGMAAWRGGHRPGTSQQQWAFARVNSFVTKSSGTWGGADKDLAKQVRGSK